MSRARIKSVLHVLRTIFYFRTIYSKSSRTVPIGMPISTYQLKAMRLHSIVEEASYIYGSSQSSLPSSHLKLENCIYLTTHIFPQGLKGRLLFCCCLTRTFCNISRIPVYSYSFFHADTMLIFSR